jgi:hypothetical protein
MKVQVSKTFRNALYDYSDNQGGRRIPYHEIYRRAGCNCHPSFISQLMRGLKPITETNKIYLLKIAKYLNLNELEVFTDGSQIP